MDCLLYSIFHLNLSYSSISVDQRRQVIERCYWPLLRLATEGGYPIGIEISGSSLEMAARVAPDWVAALKEAVGRGVCELIGSGYAQIIGPIVPAAVNEANLELGNKVYKSLLSHEPTVALVNEQAFSSGLVAHYLAAGYRAIVMEWNNPARYHPEWRPELKLLPQKALGADRETIELLWTETITFQKIQRYAHGELTLDECLNHVRSTVRTKLLKKGALALYGNDAEIFDFRPGRYLTEEPLRGQSEWKRLSQVLDALKGEQGLSLVLPSAALDLLSEPLAGRKLNLAAPEQPIPVKKQMKYNVTRWTVTGRDDLGLNTACWRIYDDIKDSASDQKLRQLCMLWRSDLRTHITRARFGAAAREIKRWKSSCQPPKTPFTARPAARVKALPVTQKGRWLTVDTEAIRLKLNCRRGLAVEELVFKDISSSPLVGTVPHGYYQDIFLGADFYTGHTIVEVPGRRRITDLSPVTAEVSAVTTELGPAIQVYGEVATPEGPIAKGLTVFENSARVDLCSTFLWEERPAGTFRTGIITLLPWAFDPHTLFYRTHNGGFQPETFALFGGEVLHPEPASALVSAHAGLGATEGVVELGDDKKGLRVSFDPRAVAAMPMILYRERAGQRLFRLLFSLGELDDTRVLPKGEEMRYGAFHARVPGLSPLRFGVTLEGISP